MHPEDIKPEDNNELVLTFIQALCMKTTSSKRAMPKFNELINQLGLQDLDNSTGVQAVIVREIQGYASVYLNKGTPEYGMASATEDNNQASVRRRSVQQRQKI